jgi:hypothetical protein
MSGPVWSGPPRQALSMDEYLARVEARLKLDQRLAVSPTYAPGPAPCDFGAGPLPSTRRRWWRSLAPPSLPAADPSVIVATHPGLTPPHICAGTGLTPPHICAGADTARGRGLARDGARVWLQVRLKQAERKQDALLVMQRVRIAKAELDEARAAMAEEDLG